MFFVFDIKGRFKILVPGGSLSFQDRRRRIATKGDARRAINLFIRFETLAFENDEEFPDRKVLDVNVLSAELTETDLDFVDFELTGEGAPDAAA